MEAAVKSALKHILDVAVRRALYRWKRESSAE
jgi:hypothetical protein